MGPPTAAKSAREVTPREVEDLLYREAALLDAWRLKEWLELLAEDAVYEVPAVDTPSGTPETALALVGDDIVRIRSRVKQLLSRSVLGEDPHSRTRRLVTNVRILEADGDALEVTANFAIYRFRRDVTEVYVGSYAHRLVLRDGQLKFRRRRSTLDMESLRPHGKLTIIL